MKIILVAGARPNFMKIAPIIQAIKKHNRQHQTSIRWQLVHTGQHYDDEMSKIFFKDLEIPEPDIYLGVDSGTHSQQTARVMVEFEKVLFREKPDLVIVVGDVNSTLAAALAAAKLHIRLAHVEAGLRSYDRRMPEEINRVLTDALSDYLFTHSPDADKNLKKEGISKGKIFFVGNVMIDTLLKLKTKSQKSKILRKLNLRREAYALLTLHRPSNVDHKENFLKILKALKEISKRIPIIFPVHPRTRRNIKRFKLNKFFKNISLIEPLGYLDFLKLMISSKFAMTDSGGMQEETTVLNIPCLTLRDTTERPITTREGTNILVGNDTVKIIKEAEKILDGKRKKGVYPALWDGNAASRIISVLKGVRSQHLTKF
ncbi:MAG: UDP-N-acetylglucosamine 2-epimerase (non-hydrolyzing) [Candidatus Omnitrophica bacterium]|nr:UDP-N-acetylglucosamine 2-epimerase (non-hydrolyzing) [Candidatus Omnitrophota bacterium]